MMSLHVGLVGEPTNEIPSKIVPSFSLSISWFAASNTTFAVSAFELSPDKFISNSIFYHLALVFSLNLRSLYVSITDSPLLS